MTKGESIQLTRKIDSRMIDHMLIMGFRVRVIPFIGFFVLAAFLGFLNHFRSIPLIPDLESGGSPALFMPEGIKTATRADVLKAVVGKNAVIIDVRDKESYEKSHIPLAVNIPEDAKDPASLLSQAVPTIRRSSPIILYCYGAACWASVNTAVKLRSAGFINLSVYVGGWEEWAKLEGKR